MQVMRSHELGELLLPLAIRAFTPKPAKTGVNALMLCDGLWRRSG